MRNIQLTKLTFFMWKTLQIFSTIPYSLLAVCDTNNPLVAVIRKIR